PSLIQQFIGNINNFNVIYLLTGGGPSNSNFYGAGDTDLLVTWLYKLTVEAADYNLASVIGIVTFILSAAFSLFAYTRTNSYKEGSN
ncbi:sugar ABC transporter, permease protein, partial [Listeria ivanovii FSL F6-596]